MLNVLRIMHLMFYRSFALVLLAGSTATTVLAQSECDARANAEEEAITREFSARSPGKGTGEAQQAWAKDLHFALQAVQQRHEACRKAHMPGPNSPQVQRVMQCIDANNRRSDEVAKRYQGRTMSSQDQAQRRADEQKLLDERMACQRLN